MEQLLTIAVILFALGVIMLIAEVLLPTGGLLVVAALLFFAGGVGIILIEGTTTQAVVALVALAVGLPVAGYVAVAAYRRMSIGAELDETASAGSLDLPGVHELAALKNRTGKTVSPLRPSGVVEFDGRRVDAMTEGGMLDAGVWVRCVAVKGTTVLVRQMEPPAGVADISPEARPAAPGITVEAAPGLTLELDVTPPASPPPPPPPPPRDDLDDLDLDLK
jgi:membrane-bound serine protease (ClpP class)